MTDFHFISDDAAGQECRPPARIAPPFCFISALALGLILSGGASANSGGCTSSVPGVDLTCTGEVQNPSAFTASSNFTVDIGTITPTTSPATIIQGSGFAGIKINAGNYGGAIDMTRGSSISVEAGSGTSRNGLVIASQASGNSKTFTISIDGSITSAAAQGDGVRLEGTSLSVFNATFGRHAVVGGGTGDDGVMVTGAQSLLLKNYGILQGGSGQPESGGEGVNAGNNIRIAEGGVTIENHGTITGTGAGPNVNGQGISVFGTGDVTIENSRRGDISGVSQGIRVEANGAVSISNAGHIEGKSKSGIEVADGTKVEISNSSAHTIEGATDGVYVHDVDRVKLDNDRGRIVGHDGAGVRIDDIDGSVSITNRFSGFAWGTATISGSDDGVRITNVDGKVDVDNRFGGRISGHDGDGLFIRDVNKTVTVDNSLLGSILGHDDGVHIRDADRDVVVRNSFGGSISGRHGDGVDIRDVRDDVDIDNSFGGRISGERGDGIKVEDVRDDVRVDNRFGGAVSGRNDGIRVDDVRDHVSIDNSFGGSIFGAKGDGVDVHDARDDVDIVNRFGGQISGHDNGVEVSDSGEDVRIVNSFGGKISGRHGDGIHINDVDDVVAIDNRFGGVITGQDDGVDVRNVDDDVRIDNKAGGSISGRNDGIHADDVDGDIKIANGSGSIGGRHGDGIDVSADGKVTVDNGSRGRITGRDSAVQIEANSVEINSAGLLRGSGTGHPTIKLSTKDGATINNKAGGWIVGEQLQSTDLIVKAHGGAVTINNDGTMIGRVDLSDAGQSDWGNVFIIPATTVGRLPARAISVTG